MKKNLVIKLCRFGRKHSPFYRFGVLPAYRNPNKNFALEYIGWYNPITKEYSVKQDRLDYYLSLNIQITPSSKAIFLKNKSITK
jgi:ribosomal protein S16